MKKRKYPIIEFDDTKMSKTKPERNLHSSAPLPATCVISFFGDAVKQYIANNNATWYGRLVMESFELPIYKISTSHGEVALLHALGSGPYVAGELEKLIAMGSKQFLVCGGCGVLKEGSRCGELYLPTVAVRDEGTSYHYVAPSREICMDTQVVQAIQGFLDERGVPYSVVKTWTTDAIYRETEETIVLRRSEGCDIVEMECASLLAVSQYKGIRLGQLLYAGDDLSKEAWETREWKKNISVRYQLLELCIDLAVIFST